MDVCSVHHNDTFLRFSVSLLGYGFYGDVLTDSERKRWMGPARYDLSGRTPSHTQSSKSFGCVRVSVAFTLTFCRSENVPDASLLRGNGVLPPSQRHHGNPARRLHLSLWVRGTEHVLWCGSSDSYDNDHQANTGCRGALRVPHTSTLCVCLLTAVRCVSTTGSYCQREERSTS